MLSETLAQYSALMVMEKEFGPAAMRRFLEDELNSYLLGRATEQRKEVPLELVENQPYIHYNKGSLVMYALRDYIGEAKMNAAVRGFLRATKMRGPPYPTSLELVDSLRAATPDSLKYLISDLFEHITLYELRTDSAVARPAPGGKVAVSLYVNAKKLRADSLGAETEQPINDWIDIGLFAKAPATPDPRIDDKVGVPLYLQKHRIRAGAQTITVLADSVPYRAGIDPLHKLDRSRHERQHDRRDQPRRARRALQPIAHAQPRRVRRHALREDDVAVGVVQPVKRIVKPGRVPCWVRRHALDGVRIARLRRADDHCADTAFLAMFGLDSRVELARGDELELGARRIVSLHHAGRRERVAIATRHGSQARAGR